MCSRLLEFQHNLQPLLLNTTTTTPALSARVFVRVWEDMLTYVWMVLGGVFRRLFGVSETTCKKYNTYVPSYLFKRIYAHIEIVVAFLSLKYLVV